MYESTFTCVCTKTYCSLWPFVCTRPSSLTFAKFVNNIKCCAHMDWRVAYGAILCFFPFLLFFYFTFCVTTTTEILMWWLLSWSKLTRKKRLIFVNSFHNVYMPPYVYTCMGKKISLNFFLYILRKIVLIFSFFIFPPSICFSLKILLT